MSFHSKMQFARDCMMFLFIIFIVVIILFGALMAFEYKRLGDCREMQKIEPSKVCMWRTPLQVVCSNRVITFFSELKQGGICENT